jgi:hypothetical protein
LNSLDNLSTGPRICLIEEDLEAWGKRKTRIVICRYHGARSWGKRFVSTSTIGRGGFEKSEVVKFVIVIRVVSGPTTRTACAARPTGVKPERAAVEISDGMTRFAISHGQIPLPFEVLYLFIARSKGILGLLESTFEGALSLCEPCCV